MLVETCAPDFMVLDLLENDVRSLLCITEVNVILINIFSDVNNCKGLELSKVRRLKCKKYHGPRQNLQTKRVQKSNSKTDYTCILYFF